MRFSDEAVVFLVLGEDLGKAGVEELVLGSQSRSFALLFAFGSRQVFGQPAVALAQSADSLVRVVLFDVCLPWRRCAV